MILFRDYKGWDIYINPQQVVCLRRAMKKANTYIYLSNGDECLVEIRMEEVAKRLTPAPPRVRMPQ